MRRLAAGLLAMVTTACLAGAMDTPVLPKDKAAPVEVIGGGEWSGEELIKKGLVLHGLQVATIRPDPSKGPVTLLVDLAGWKQDPKAEVSPRVAIDLACWSKPDACTSLSDQLSMRFESRYMSNEEAERTPGVKAPQAAGRQFRRYTFMPGLPEAQIRISVHDTVNFTPHRLRAVVFYGEHDGKPLQGQGTRLGQWLSIVGGAAVVLVVALLWLRRR
jgi:hypothetical protein